MKDLLRETVSAFERELAACSRNDDPQALHRARVAWRRFRSVLHLLGVRVKGRRAPDPGALRPLWSAMGAVRDLDVAIDETLAGLRTRWIGDDEHRSQVWAALLDRLEAQRAARRRELRAAIANPDTLQALQALRQWMEQWPDLTPRPALKTWIRDRVRRQRQRVRRALAAAHNAAGAHAARIEAKRLRYGIEVLSPWLWRHRSPRWWREAAQWQDRLGRHRDLDQAIVLSIRAGADAEWIAFLRGLQAGVASGG